MATAKAKWDRHDAERARDFIVKELANYVAQIELCGSFRRGLSEVGDLDFVVVPKPGMSDLLRTRIAELGRVLAQGSRTIRVVGRKGIQADFMIIDRKSFGSAVLHTTGSAQFNIWCRAIAKKRGMKLNEYGLWKNEKIIAQDEIDILRTLHMEEYIPPTRRK